MIERILGRLALAAIIGGSLFSAGRRCVREGRPKRRVLAIAQGQAAVRILPQEPALALRVHLLRVPDLPGEAVRRVLEILAAAGAGLLVGFLLGSLAQYRHACRQCIDRRLTEALEP